MNIDNVYDFAQKAYDDANCKYDGKNYFTHIDMVKNYMGRYCKIFKYPHDYLNSSMACLTHDLIEDAKLTFNDIKCETNEDVARITLNVTDVPAENRLMRQMLTMPKTISDYRSIVVKMCDIAANASYSRDSRSSMYEKYITEYEYKRPIFKMALKWYEDSLNLQQLNEFWAELDEIHNY
jgi:(p)ppGpp synthase/HD superfamily hydrolase